MHHEAVILLCEIHTAEITLEINLHELHHFSAICWEQTEQMEYWGNCLTFW
jgi:hypothetical protein